MDENEWLNATDPRPMVDFVRARASERKRLLLAVACCCRAASNFQMDEYYNLLAVFEQERAQEPIVQRELGVAMDAFIATFGVWRRQRQEAGLATQPLQYLCDATDFFFFRNLDLFDERFLSAAVESQVSLIPGATSREAEFAYQAHLLRCIFGNPFSPSQMALCPDCGETSPAIGLQFPGPCEWCGGLGRLHRGHEWVRWNDSTVLRIATGIYEERAFERLPVLADALLDSGCEDEDLIAHCRSAGPHIRGCFAVDSILGKE